MENSYKSEELNTCHIFNTDTSTWKCLPNLPQPLHSHALCYDESRYVYSVGGLGIHGKVFGDCYQLDTYSLDSGWSIIELEINPVFSHTCHIIDNSLLIIGGIGQSGQQMSCQKLDLCSSYQEHFDLPSREDGKLRMYFNHTSHLIEGDSIQRQVIVVGGGGNCFSFGTHINSNISTYLPDMIIC